MARQQSSNPEQGREDGSCERRSARQSIEQSRAGQPVLKHEPARMERQHCYDGAPTSQAVKVALQQQ